MAKISPCALFPPRYPWLLVVGSGKRANSLYVGVLMRSEAGSGLRAETEAMRRALTDHAGRARRTLVALGDSITYGWGLPHASSYPALLERRLNEPGAGSGRWRVINAGVPGDTVLCAERRYERDVASWQADVLVISLGLNDAALRRTRIDDQREHLWRAHRNPWLRWAMRLDRARTLWGAGMAGAPAMGAGGQPQAEEHRAEPRVCVELYVRALEDLVKRAQGQGLRVYLTSLPSLAWERIAVDQAAWYRRYDSLVRQVAGSSGALFIDVAQNPQRSQGAGCWQEDGIHPSAKGQAWLAECITEGLRRDGCSP